MKNSKFVIGATSFALAIAGAFAFKTVNKVTPISAYTQTGTNCIYKTDVACRPDQGDPCTVNRVTLYTKGNAPVHCGKTLRTIGE